MTLSVFPLTIRNAIYQAMGITEEHQNSTSPNVESGSEAGSNYLGVIHRVNLGGKSLIIKTQPENQSRRELFGTGQFFTNEANFYNHILPRLQPITTAPIIFPKTIFANTDVIVMENLIEQGYRTVPRGTMNIAMAKIVVKGMAAFHASAMAVKHLAPQDFEQFRTYVYEIFNSSTNKFAQNLWSNFNVETLVGGNDDPELISKIRPYVKNGFKFLNRFSSAEEAEPFVTLCQSDMWTNNFLFRFEKDEPVSMALLDFQLFRIASPVTDLLYFIYICTDSKFRKTYLKSLLDDYYSTFAEQIRDYDLDPEVVYPKSVYQEHLKSHIPFGLASGVMMIPLFLNDGPPIDFDELASNSTDTEVTPFYCSKAASERIREMFTEFFQNELRSI